MRSWRSRAIRCILLCVCAGMPAAAAEGDGPVSASAEDFEYLQHDQSTGALQLRIRSSRAVAQGDAVFLGDVRVSSFDSEGRESLSISSDRGRVVQGHGPSVSGHVRVSAKTASGSLLFECASLEYGDDRMARCATEVSGTLRSGDGGVDVAFSGVGLEIATDGSSGALVRHVVLTVGGERFGAWRISADGGFTFSEREGASVVVLNGPVHGQGKRLQWSADALSVRSGADPEAFVIHASGNVAADGILERSLPTGSERCTVRARAAEVASDGRTVLYGAVDDPATLGSGGSELRGTRIELAADSIQTDGGATSSLEWEAP